MPWPDHPVKRLLDILFSVVLLILLAPVMAGVALWVGFRLGRPVLFRQTRPGKTGTPFVLVKFRSMGDKRVLTGLRASGLDELPELLNILRGDMSFVGPRPLLMDYLDRYTPEQARRHEVRPGLTGWAQVNGRNALDWDKRFQLDVWYVDHATPWMDFRILWLTFLQLVRPGEATEPGEFTPTHADN